MIPLTNANPNEYELRALSNGMNISYLGGGTDTYGGGGGSGCRCTRIVNCDHHSAMPSGKDLAVDVAGSVVLVHLLMMMPLIGVVVMECSGWILK